MTHWWKPFLSLVVLYLPYDIATRGAKQRLVISNACDTMHAKHPESWLHPLSHVQTALHLNECIPLPYRIELNVIINQLKLSQSKTVDFKRSISIYRKSFFFFLGALILTIISTRNHLTERAMSSPNLCGKRFPFASDCLNMFLKELVWEIAR